MAFHPVRFPLDVALGARGGPERLTEIVTLSSGHEERNSKWADSRRRYNAGYGVKSREDMHAVLEFFEERRGRFHGFLWRDAMDNCSNANGIVSPLDQAIGTGDGAITSFQLIKTYGGSLDPYQRRITNPVVASVRVAVNGSELSGSGFSVDALSGEVTLAAAPPIGQAVTAGYKFDVSVRFDTDRLDVELSGFDAAEVPTIPLIEIKQ